MPAGRLPPQRTKISSRLRKAEPLTPVARSLPPLNALRAFEAAARLGGFVAAAGELGVSPGAISRQVKILEDSLGAPLFARLAHGVELNEAGRRLGANAGRAFDLLARAMAEGTRRSLRFNVSASFYLRWLLPRYASLRAALPRAAFELALISSGSPGPEDGDLAILFHRRGAETGADAGIDPGNSERLFADTSVLVCAPSLLGRRKAPLPLHDISRLPRILGTSDNWDWRCYAEMQGLGELLPSRALKVDIEDAAIQAALAGEGVALVEKRFVAELLASARLLQPFALPPVSLGEYRLHWRPSLGRRSAVLALRRWLKAELAAN